MWRIYIADSLQCAAMGISQIAGTGYIEKRYSEIFHISKEKKEERTAEELVADIINEIGIEVI